MILYCLPTSGSQWRASIYRGPMWVPVQGIARGSYIDSRYRGHTCTGAFPHGVADRTGPRASLACDPAVAGAFVSSATWSSSSDRSSDTGSIVSPDRGSHAGSPCEFLILCRALINATPGSGLRFSVCRNDYDFHYL